MKCHLYYMEYGVWNIEYENIENTYSLTFSKRGEARLIDFNMLTHFLTKIKIKPSETYIYIYVCKVWILISIRFESKRS